MQGCELSAHQGLVQIVAPVAAAALILTAGAYWALGLHKTKETKARGRIILELSLSLFFVLLLVFLYGCYGKARAIEKGLWWGLAISIPFCMLSKRYLRPETITMVFVVLLIALTLSACLVPIPRWTYLSLAVAYCLTRVFALFFIRGACLGKTSMCRK